MTLTLPAAVAGLLFTAIVETAPGSNPWWIKPYAGGYIYMDGVLLTMDYKVGNIDSTGREQCTVFHFSICCIRVEMDVQYYWWAMGLGGCSVMKKLVPFSPNKVTGLVNWYDANLGLTLAAEPAAITAPTDIANCGLWLDAAQGITETDGKVSAWADQSGNSRDAAQGTAGSRPVLTANVIGVFSRNFIHIC